MKLTIIIETVMICIITTIFSIFTIDGVAVRKSEISSVIAIETENVVNDYFDGTVNTVNLLQELETSFIEASGSESENVDVALFYADAEKGIVSLLVEVTYKQPTGRPRLISYKRVYIREMPEDPSTEEQYLFTRTIDADYYKNDAGNFVSEENGGLKADSIWRTESYESVLDSVFVDN